MPKLELNIMSWNIDTQEQYNKRCKSYYDNIPKESHGLSLHSLHLAYNEKIENVLKSVLKQPSEKRPDIIALQGINKINESTKELQDRYLKMLHEKDLNIDQYSDLASDKKTTDKVQKTWGIFYNEEQKSLIIWNKNKFPQITYNKEIAPLKTLTLQDKITQKTFNIVSKNFDEFNITIDKNSEAGKKHLAPVTAFLQNINKKKVKNPTIIATNMNSGFEHSDRLQKLENAGYLMDKNPSKKTSYNKDYTSTNFDHICVKGVENKNIQIKPISIDLLKEHPIYATHFSKKEKDSPQGTLLISKHKKKDSSSPETKIFKELEVFVSDHLPIMYKVKISKNKNTIQKIFKFLAYIFTFKWTKKIEHSYPIIQPISNNPQD